MVPVLVWCSARNASTRPRAERIFPRVASFGTNPSAYERRTGSFPWQVVVCTPSAPGARFVLFHLP